MIGRALVVALVASSATARADTAVSARPSTISLGATQGKVLTRDVTITADPATPPGPWTIQVVPLSTAQGEEQDQAAISAVEVDETGSRRVRVTIDVKNTPPGAYAAEVAVRAAGDPLVRVPITVKVKDAPLLPIIVLLAGVVLGLVLQFYRANWMERDDVLARIGSLWQRAPSDLPDAFNAVIQQRTRTAKDALARQATGEAKSAIAKAEQALTRFLAREDDWRRQLNFGSELAATVRGLKDVSTTTYRDNLVSQIERQIQIATEDGEVNDLATKLSDLQGQTARYIRLEGDLRALATDPRQASAVKGWRGRIDRAPVDGDGDALAKIEAEIEAAFAAPAGAARDLDATGASKLPVPPRVEDISRGTRARKRSQLAANVALGVGALALAALGYHQLYEENATFGGFWAHATLLFWGFGSELTRSTAAGFLRQGGIPDAAG